MFDQGSVGSGSLQQYLLPLGIVLIVIVLRGIRPRKLKVERLWAFPLIYLVFLASGLSAAPPPVTPVSIGILALSAAIGGLIGWQRGRFTRLDIDPATHEMTSRASVLGIAFILAILMARVAMRSYLTQAHDVLGVPPLVFTDGLLVLAVAMLSAQRLEIWIRATRMLNQARAGGIPPV